MLDLAVHHGKQQVGVGDECRCDGEQILFGMIQVGKIQARFKQ